VSSAVPVIPDKLYFTIGEVSNLIGVATHSIRYWEKEDAKSRTGVIKTQRSKENERRVYSRDVVLTLLKLKTLIVDKSHTVPGALKLLKGSKERMDSNIEGYQYISTLQTLHQRLLKISATLVG